MPRNKINLPSQSSVDLADDIAQFTEDPLGFVLFAFPWGEKGTILEDEEGPDKWQVLILEEIAQQVQERRLEPEKLFGAIQVAVASGHGVGKAIDVDTLIETPHGRRKWGDIQKGDFLFGRDGRPTEVTARYDHPDVDFYRVTFDDGTQIDTCGDHQWSVRGRQHRRNGLEGWSTMTTKQILDRGVKRANGAGLARQWEIPAHDAVEFQSQEVGVHPYFLGVWIGDGSCGKTGYSKPSQEIAQRVRDVCGYELTVAQCGTTHYARGIKGLFDPTLLACRSYERFIPDEYKYNSAEVRMEVFRGLCDTDGEVINAGSIGYSTTSRRLAEDVVWLARSLGCKASINKAIKKAGYRDSDGVMVECRDCYRLTINAPFNPFTHEEKKAKHKPSEHRYTVRWIDSIEYIGKRDGMCVTVAAEDSLYLANDFICTHNSGLIAWIILWFMSVRQDPQIVVTANTVGQLTGKTWREVAKWHRLAINYDWFAWTATTFYLKERQSTWRAVAQPWSQERSEAFAGTHDKNVLMIFDEASNIHDKIWEVAEGAMTTPGAMWIVFGNPTRNQGRFRECFRQFRHRWINHQVDSRTAKMANRVQIDQWVDDHGEDSDFVRVRVRGIFPRADVDQLIPQDVVEEAMERYKKLDEKHRSLGYNHDEVEIHERDSAPVILTLDVARRGADQTVVGMRRGRIFRIIAKWRELDTWQVSKRFAALLDEIRPDAAFVDGNGIGAGVFDHLVTLNYDVESVLWSTAASNPRKLFNKRTEMWWDMLQWLKDGGMIPADTEIRDDLTTPMYQYNNKDQIQLESKEDMKARGLPSPDCGDALAMSFYMPVAPRMTASAREKAKKKKRAERRNILDGLLIYICQFSALCDNGLIGLNLISRSGAETCRALPQTLSERP